MQQTNITVNQIGKYLYKHIDGAFKIHRSGNMCDVWFTLLYQIPRPFQIPGKGKEYNDVHEMTINLNLTTYQNKIRFNILETDPNERTLGCYVIPPADLEDLERVKKYILQQTIKAVHKYYSEYEILF